ncbi:hypothetical protein [Saccharicrinis sp. FJH54]|uniref:hypothetical protein n=1 Tax=Saccharicrinis sp. FJH54 TaxID=3344665 RepID=UPI0035D46E91
MKTPVNPLNFVVILISLTFLSQGCKVKSQHEKSKMQYVLSANYKIDISHSDGIPYERNGFNNYNRFQSASVENMNKEDLINTQHSNDTIKHLVNQNLFGYTISEYDYKIDSVFKIKPEGNSGFKYKNGITGHYNYHILKIREKQDTVPYTIHVQFTDTINLNCKHKQLNHLIAHAINSELHDSFKKYMQNTIIKLPFEKPDYNAWRND